MILSASVGVDKTLLMFLMCVDNMGKKAQ